MNDPKVTVKAPSLKERILYDVRLAVWAILALLIAVLLVLELVPAQEPTAAITVSERVTVESELVNVQAEQYVTTVSGAFFNPTDEPITVDSLQVSVTAKQAFRGVDFEGFVLHPRTSQEIYLSWVGGTDFDTVSRITVKINGEELVVRNANASSAPTISGAFIFYFVLLAIVAWFLIRAIKLRYYLYQEAMLSRAAE
jgi:hypothetical protein